ncbi:hypothetical protein ACFL5O_10940 [Myxococcota bacterium]
MWNRQQQSEVASLARERRQREDDAPRLRDEVSELAELSIEVTEYRPPHSVFAARHTRRVVVEHAPALFVLPCTEERCKGGGHDLTLEVMRELRLRSSQFTGEDTCTGQLGAGECGRVLSYVAYARYADDPSPSAHAGVLVQARSRVD